MAFIEKIEIELRVVLDKWFKENGVIEKINIEKDIIEIRYNVNEGENDLLFVFSYSNGLLSLSEAYEVGELNG